MLQMNFRDMKSPLFHNRVPYSSKVIEHAHAGVLPQDRRLGFYWCTLPCSMLSAEKNQCWRHSHRVGFCWWLVVSWMFALMNLAPAWPHPRNTEENWCPGILTMGSLSFLNYLEKKMRKGWGASIEEWKRREGNRRAEDNGERKKGKEGGK